MVAMHVASKSKVFYLYSFMMFFVTTCLLFLQLISSGQDEKPISIKSCIVDIAYDYRKRENVFKFTTYNGSQYLFQVI